MNFYSCVLAVALLVLAAEGRLLSNYFHNDMVLQYDNAHLFGWALDATGKPVAVDIAITVTNDVSGRATKVAGKSDATTGYWTVTLPAYTPDTKSGESLADTHKIVISATGFDTDGLADVLFGNVFLCGGQSNMASIGVRHAENNKAELELAGNGALLNPCGSHSNQHVTYLQATGQLLIGSRCLAYRHEDAAIDTKYSVFVDDCAPDAASAKAANQFFTYDASTGHILDAEGDCLTAYVEGWSWERCRYAEPTVELGACCDQEYCQWTFDDKSGHLLNVANALCLSAINEDNQKVDDPFENFRIFRTEFDYFNESLKELRNIATHWTKPTVTTLAKFSAVCWYMGRNIYEHQPQKGMPIGLVESAVSGSYIEAWMSSDALNKCPCHYPAWGGGNTPEWLWNAMIAPLTYSAVAGMAWYQAESNIDNAECYKCMFPAMIEDWRAKFPKTPSGAPVPFVFVEITPRSTDPDFHGADLRLAQQSAFNVSRVGMAPTQDCGDAESPFNTEHPRVKKPVGHRLGLQMRALLFGENVPEACPDVSDVKFGDDKKTVNVIFDKASFAGDFTLRSNVYCPVEDKFCVGYAFELMANDNNWYPATVARLPSSKGFGVAVTPTSAFPATATIVKIRHLYAPWPLPVIYSAAGIPLSPFMVDVN